MELIKNMKALRFTSLLLPLAISVFVSSCIEDALVEIQAEETLVIDQSNYDVESSAGTLDVSISTHGKWGCVTNASWVRFPSSEGDGNVIHVQYDRNPTYDARTATVTVACGTVIKTFLITQKQTDAMNSEMPEGKRIGCDGGLLELKVVSNVDYTCSVDPDASSWLSIQNSRALSTSIFYVRATLNQSISSRTGKVYVRSNEIGTQEYTIIQEGRQPISLTESSYSMNLGTTHTLTLRNGNQDVYWTTSDSKIATVDNNGRVTALSSGQATIYAHLYDMTVGCVITVKTSTYLAVDLNGQWRTSSISLGNSYNVYESFSNWGINSSYATMKIEFSGKPNFYFYYTAYGETNYDYVWVSALDAAKPTSNEVSYNYLSRNTSSYNPAYGIGYFTRVNISNDGRQHHVWVTYKKDASYSDYNDRGYVAIPKNN